MWFVVEAHFKALNVLKSVKKFNEIVSSLTGEFLFVIWSLRPKKYNSHFFWTPCISPYSSLDSLLSGVQWQPTPSTCNYKSPTRLSSPQITEIWTFLVSIATLESLWFSTSKTVLWPLSCDHGFTTVKVLNVISRVLGLQDVI